MRYLVMECAPSYAVVLDEAGAWHKVPNLGYEVGQTLEHALVDEAAVCAALKSGHLGYYASDVAAHEPVRPKDELLHCPNVLLTPHVAWATQEALARLSAEVCANLEAFLQGERRNLV